MAKTDKVETIERIYEIKHMLNGAEIHIDTLALAALMALEAKEAGITSRDFLERAGIYK